MKRLAALLVSAALLLAPGLLLAQGFITSHSIPIGQGAGVQGWGTGGPCAVGQVLSWQSGPTSDPSCVTVSTSATNVSSPFNLLLGPTHIFVGSATSIATDVALSKDCTLLSGGAITCTSTNSVAFGYLSTQTTSIANSELTSPTIGINSTACTLGSTCTVTTVSTSPTTGSGSVVLQSSPYVVTTTIASPTIVSAFSAVGLVTNADLVNAATTPNGVTCTLGSTCTLTASASSLTVGTTSVFAGVTSQVLFVDKSKTLSQYGVQGSGATTLMTSGAFTSGNCHKTDAGGNAVDAGGVCTLTIASGAKALATSSISSATCSSAQTTSATGTLTTDVVGASFNGDPTGVTGYVPLTTGMLTIIPYPTADTVNFKVCNNTASSITPGAITLNWRVTR